MVEFKVYPQKSDVMLVPESSPATVRKGIFRDKARKGGSRRVRYR